VIKSLYISYFSLAEPLVQNQVLPYLRELVKGGVRVSLLTFETTKKINRSAAEIASQKKLLSAEGIDWDFKIYHKRFSVISTAYDVLVGAIYAFRHVTRFGTDILHARAHVPAAMALLAKTFIRNKSVKVLFDIRGFLPEEYTDAGVWRENGLIYRAVKCVESWLMDNVDGFVVLTERARAILFGETNDPLRDGRGRPVAVIPCCVDGTRFTVPSESERNEIRDRIGAHGRTVIAYIGSGGWYLTKETEDFYRIAKSQMDKSFALVLTQGPKEKIVEMLARAGFSEKDRFVSSVTPTELPSYLWAADFAVSFIKPCYSRQASSPTKNAEYLASGLPVVVNDGIGDTSHHLTVDRVGVVLSGFSNEEIRRGLAELKSLLKEGELLTARCRDTSENRFSLTNIGGVKYRDLYRRLSGSVDG
jgi:glycosyltransferase involved in cell wall biosynthesis